MATYSQARLEEKIYKTISRLLVSKKLYSIPENAFITIHDVKLGTDNRNATIFYSYLGSPEMGVRVQHSLESSSGIIQKSLAVALNTKNTPKLLFKPIQ